MISVWFSTAADEPGRTSRRQQSLRARALLREAMSGVGWDEDYRLRTLPSGKPVLEGVDGHVSISHTDGLVACAVADHAVGVDVERADQRRDVLAIAGDWMHESERCALIALPEETRARRFLIHFTLREAFVKATGVGLGGETDSVRFDVAAEGAGHTATLRGAAGLWRCHVLDPAPGYVGAVVSSSQLPEQLQIRRSRFVSGA